MIGRIIGNYKIESKLGEGGMGAVYKGVDTMLDREVAIKALRPELASQTAVVERFRSEAVTLAKLHHPNIATLYSLFRQTDELYMVLEYVRGETLDSIMQRRGALPADEVIPVFCQILDGINHAHEYGIIHRDIKPANMMLTEKGTLKVLDFGIARLLGSSRMTRAGNVIGTLEYMAPEQVRGQETDARTDIYALGMMLYEVLTGRTPFVSENEFELMKLQIEGTPAPPRALNSTIPQEVEDAIMRAIRKDPDRRFQTAGEFREVLLDAGYAAQGKMRRITGPQSAPSVSSDDSQAISRPDAAEKTTDPEKVIKETRLGAPNSSPHEIKETRLGGSAVSAPAAIPFASTYDEPTASFLDNLTWIHYAGAGGGVLAAAVILFMISIYAFSSSEPEKPAVQTQAQPKATPTVQATPLQAAATPKPVAPSSEVISQPAPQLSSQPIAVTPIELPASSEKKEAQPSEEKRSVAKANRTPRPAPTVKTSTVRNSGSGTKSKADTRCALTGDC